MAVGTFATTVGALAVICGAVIVSRIADAPAFRVGAHVVAGARPETAHRRRDGSPGVRSHRADGDAFGRPVAFALATGAFYALAWWYSRTDVLTDLERRFLPATVANYAIVATGLGVIVFALELSGLGVSVAWILFGSVLLGIGLATDVRGVRALGIAVLGLATAKVFLFDTRDLDTVARTLSFLVLGAVLLIASYVYARSRATSRSVSSCRNAGGVAHRLARRHAFRSTTAPSIEDGSASVAAQTNIGATVSGRVRFRPSAPSRPVRDRDSPRSRRYRRRTPDDRLGGGLRDGVRSVSRPALACDGTRRNEDPCTVV